MTKILCAASNDFIFSYLSESQCESFYKPWVIKNSFFSKIFKGISCFLSFFNLESLFFGKWKKEIKQNTYIVLDEVGLHRDLVKFINKHKNKFCIYLANPVKSVSGKNNLSRFKCPVYTFDELDAKKFNFRYYHYFLPFIEPAEKEDVIYDFMFVGLNKGRKECIDYMLKNLKGYSSYIKIAEGRYPLKYKDYINILHSSKCIIEILQSQQTGITLRTIESLYYSKKLITNNENVVNFPFYNSSNIYIIKNTKDINFSEIRSFMNKKQETINEFLFNEYKCDEWINHFNKEIF